MHCDALNSLSTSQAKIWIEECASDNYYSNSATEIVDARARKGTE